MPSDSTETKAQLAAEAERLFAERGIWQVAGREIVVAAGQRNASAISYHFGSRDGVLEYILRAHGDPIDARRGELLATVGHDGSTAAIVDALVGPMVACLGSESGRRYLNIVAQVMATVGTWRGDDLTMWPNLTFALTTLESRPAAVDADVRVERVNAMILLMTASLADRARKLDGRVEPPLSAMRYETNLGQMLVGVLEPDDRRS